MQTLLVTPMTLLEGARCNVVIKMDGSTTAMTAKAEADWRYLGTVFPVLQQVRLPSLRSGFSEAGCQAPTWAMLSNDTKRHAWTLLASDFQALCYNVG